MEYFTYIEIIIYFWKFLIQKFRSIDAAQMKKSWKFNCVLNVCIAKIIVENNYTKLILLYYS
jgi:hypothetical protein